LTLLADPHELIRLSRPFFERSAVRVARGLLGQRLIRRSPQGLVAGVIVETEAYLGVEDKAAHSYQGRRTERNESMYQAGGTVYVFLNYGLHHLFNVVVRTQDIPEAVLIRAIEPTDGIELMFQRRPRARLLVDLCSGPGKLGAAFAIDRTLDRADLTCSQEVLIEQLTKRTVSTRRIVVAKRVGVDYAGEWADAPLRFYLKGNPHVSVV
jgi:DNA-3-methyladenine glycosylase